MLFYKYFNICVLYRVLFVVFITGTESQIYSEYHENKLKPLEYNDTLSPVIEEVSTLPPCSISVSWSCDQCEDFGLSKFIVYWSDGTEGTDDVNDTTFSYVINGLNAATNYSILVSAVYEDDKEYESNSTSTVTDVGDPPDIAYINVESFTDTTITLSWNTTDQECPVKEYDINYSGPVLCSTRTHGGETTSTEPRTTLSGLLPYTDYNITIAAVSTDGVNGNVTDVDVITDEAVPGIPENIVSKPLTPSSVQVTWEAPLECNGDLLDYTISWTLEGSNIFVGNATTPNMTYLVDDLEECGNYEFYVNASTSIGFGDAATTMSRTLPKAPSSVEIFESEDVTARSVNLTWTPPDTLCPVFSYTLEGIGTVLWNSGHPDVQATVVPGNETFCEVDDLVPWTNYSVCITATTRAGTGEPACTKFQTLEDVPSAPVDLTYEVLSSSNVSVSWKPPMMINGDLLNYTITWGDDGDIEMAVLAPNVTDYMITDLTACVKYTVSVTGNTTAGEGEPAITEPLMDPEKPGNITSLECGETTSTTLEVKWGKPDTACEVNYTVSAVGRILWNASMTHHTESTTKESITLTGLVPYSGYEVTITPQTEAGIRGSSYPCGKTTDQGVAGSPVNLTVVEDSITSDSFKIRWREPVEKNGILSEFFVYLINTEDQVMETYDVYYNASINIYEFTFIDLSSSYHYRANVSAKTYAGYGKPAETSATTKDDSNLGLVLGITIPVIVIVVAAAGLGYYHREKIRSRVESFRS